MKGIIRKDLDQENVLIYGAGESGVLLVKESRINPNFPYRIVGFLDDNPNKIDGKVYGLKVLGGLEKVKEIVEKKDISKIIISMPSASQNRISNILKEINKIEGLSVKILPNVDNLIEKGNLTTQLRNIKLEDLLGREEIEINTKEVFDFIQDKVIFVTGGGGSIGSELINQIAKYNPKKIINIEINENASYLMELELKRKYPYLDYKTEIASVRDIQKLDMLFNKYRPDILFHAAAHKHVPLMENNPEEAIKNNIFGTKNIAECCLKYELESVVLISTDKAVNPTNIMGATKRVCEMIFQKYSEKSSYTKFMAVRFGNVLGSNGSVIPIFSKLIEEGKNLTLTHKDIIRYFMTIPEAAQLVIEAATIGKGGEILILDMEEPVKIYDLAKNMIKLSGSTVGIDIVGLRPGEKLFEELRTSQMTEQELVRRFHQALTDISTLAEAIGELHWKRAFFDKAARTLENESMPFEERLRLACEQSHVFGGMGSWNDSPPFSAHEHGLSDEFEKTTSALYEIRSTAMAHLRRKSVK